MGAMLALVIMTQQRIVKSQSPLLAGSGHNNSAFTKKTAELATA
jgi:hypothetical protein